MKVGSQSFSSTAASNIPNCSADSPQCAGASSPSAFSLARSTWASSASASLTPACTISDWRTDSRVNGFSRSTGLPA